MCSFLSSTLSGACAGFQHVVKLSNKFQHRNWNNWAEVAPTFLAPLQTYNWRGTMLWEIGGECWINSFTRNFTNFRDLTSNPFQLFYCKEIVSSEINIIAIWVLIVIFRSVTFFMNYWLVLSPLVLAETSQHSAQHKNNILKRIEAPELTDQTNVPIFGHLSSVDLFRN